MAKYKYLDGTDSLTNPLAWDGGAVPLYDYGSTVDVGLGRVTLQDIAPDTMTVDLGSGAELVLDNAAVGANLDTRTAGLPPGIIFQDNSALIRVVGYDTNYGMIESSHGPADTGSYQLDIYMEAYSQLNNKGTVTAYSQSMPGVSRLTTASLAVNSDANTGVLNNDGQIDVIDDAHAIISTVVIGTGRITVASPDMRPDGSPYTPGLTLYGPVAATQTVELDAGQLTLGGSSADPDLFAATVAGWNSTSQLFLTRRNVSTTLIQPGLEFRLG